MARRSSPSTSTLALGAAGAVAVAAALAVVARRRRASGSADAGGAPGPELAACACGERFRTAGATGRHQVFWLVDAPEGDPILGDRCPSCERLLIESVVVA